MVQGYYKLEEAAEVLGISPDNLKRMAQKNEIRSFQDRGTWRFRIQDVQELARQRGLQSDPEAPVPASGPTSKGPKSLGPKSLGPKSLGPKSIGPKSTGPASAGPKSALRSPTLSKKEEIFEFELSSDEVDLGAGLEGFVQKPGASGKQSGRNPLSPKPGSDSDVRLVGTGSDAQPLTPKPGSDSDVRLVGEGSDDFGAALVDHVPTPKPGSDSGARLVGQPGSVDFDATVAFDTQGAIPDSDVRLEGLPGPSTPKVSGQKSALHRPTRPSKIAPSRSDSGVRLVPMDSDSDVRLTPESGGDVPIGDLPMPGAKDSDVRLERYEITPDRSDEGMLTEEINLDEEIRRREEAQKARKPMSKLRKKSEMASPFELTESQMESPGGATEDSSDFDIDLGSTVALGGEDFGLELPAGMTQLKGAPSSKAGNDTEQVDFALSDELPATPKPGRGNDDSSDNFELSASSEADSDSSFELEIDSDDDLQAGVADSDSVELSPSASEFELALNSDSEMEAVGDSDSADLSPSSDSEFELTIDSDSEFDLSVDSAADSLEVKDESSEDFELSVDDSDSGEAAGEESDFELSVDDSSGEAASISGEQDIFESDEIPELGDESASDVQSLDSDSAFEEDDISVEDESGSQVMALDEEEADEGAVTMAGDEGDFTFEEEEGEGEASEEAGEAADDAFSEIDEEGDEAEASTTARQPQYLAAPPWGVAPVLFMFPCVIIMLLVGFMGFELVQSMNGYRPPGFLTKTFSELLGKPLP